MCSFLLLSVTALLHLFVLQELKAEVDRALTDVGKELSQDAHFVDSGQSWAGSAVAVYGTWYLRDYLEERQTVGILKSGARAVSLLGSTWDSDTSTLTLRAAYRVHMPMGVSWFHPIWVVQTKKVRGWNGFLGRGAGAGPGEEELVYVTEYGVVYHRKLDCRHLKLSIRQAALEDIPDLRNTEGAKYYPCEFCWEKDQSILYITDDGNRYHGTLHCQGLARGIRTVRISQTGGLPPCAVCGG